MALVGGGACEYLPRRPAAWVPLPAERERNARCRPRGAGKGKGGPLLHCRLGLGGFGPVRPASSARASDRESSVVNTAVSFRHASSSQGFEIRAWDVQALLSDEWERACDVEPPWNFTRRVCEEKFKDYWGLGCRKDPFW